MAKKTIMVRVDQDLYNTIHTLMGYTLVSDEGLLIKRLHHGNFQDFYRRLLQEGCAIVKTEWEVIKKEYESKDQN